MKIQTTSLPSHVCALLLTHSVNLIDYSVAPEATLPGSSKASSPIPQSKDESTIHTGRSPKAQGKKKAVPQAAPDVKPEIAVKDEEHSSSNDEGEEEIDDLDEEDEEEEGLINDKAATTKRYDNLFHGRSHSISYPSVKCPDCFTKARRC